MRKTIIVAVGLLALLTTACQPAPGTTPVTAAESGPVQALGASVVWIANDGMGNNVSKFCDAGRTVYIVDGDSFRAGPAIAVVENAAECAQ